MSNWSDKPCKLWTGAHNGKGYGVKKVTSGSRYVHRIAYADAYGPIPEGMEVDHLCQQPSCIEPTHLEAVTPSENKARVGKRITQCKRGHNFDEANTYWQAGNNGKRRCRKCHADDERARRARV